MGTLRTFEESASEPRLRVARQSREGRFDQGKIWCTCIQSKEAFSSFKDLRLTVMQGKQTCEKGQKEMKL